MKDRIDWVNQLDKWKHTLTRTEGELIDFINQHPEKVCPSTLRELVEMSGVSKPVVINCYKKLEFADYKTFIMTIERFFSSQIDSLSASRHMLSRVKTVDQLLRESAGVDIRALERLSASISTEDLINISSAIHRAISVYVMGEGTGFYPAHYLSRRLRRYGIKTYFVDQDIRHIADILHPAGKGDLLLLFHYSDRDDWLWPVLRLAHQSSIETLLFSGVIHPDYVKGVNAFFHIPRGEMNFKNSMAVPMFFANQILLSYELIYKSEAESHLTELEESRSIWDRA